MINKNIIVLVFPLLFLLIQGNFIHAQSLRGLVNKGVDQYDDQKFPDAEANFKKGLDTAPDNFNAEFNLGDAYFKQKRYDEAVKSFEKALVKTQDRNLKAKAFHNIGNSFLKAQKLKESVAAFKESLKLNPQDMETKYNLSYALDLLKNKQQNKQNQNQKNQDNKNNKNDKDKNKQDQDKKDQDQKK